MPWPPLFSYELFCHSRGGPCALQGRLPLPSAPGCVASLSLASLSDGTLCVLLAGFGTLFSEVPACCTVPGLQFLSTTWLRSIVWRCSHRVVSLQMRKLRLARPLCPGTQAWGEEAEKVATTISSFLLFIASLPAWPGSRLLGIWVGGVSCMLSWPWSYHKPQAVAL